MPSINIKKWQKDVLDEIREDLPISKVMENFLVMLGAQLVVARRIGVEEVFAHPGIDDEVGRYWARIGRGKQKEIILEEIRKTEEKFDEKIFPKSRFFSNFGD